MNFISFLKKHHFYYILILLAIYLLFIGFKTDKNLIFNIIPIFTFQLPESFKNYFKTISIAFPYFMIVLLLIITLIYYSRFINTTKLKRTFQIVNLIILGIILLMFAPFSQALVPNFSGSTNIPSFQTYVPGSTTSQSSSSSSSSFSSESTTGVMINVSHQNFSNFNSGILNIFFLLVIIFILILLVRASKVIIKTSNKKPSPKKDRERKLVLDSTLKTTIIFEYLKLSRILESRGINPDFSLTPVEFENDTIYKLKLKEMNIITTYYELARFSSHTMTEHDFEVFKSNLESIYEYLSFKKGTIKN